MEKLKTHISNRRNYKVIAKCLNSLICNWILAGDKSWTNMKLYLWQNCTLAKMHNLIFWQNYSLGKSSKDIRHNCSQAKSWTILGKTSADKNFSGKYPLSLKNNTVSLSGWREFEKLWVFPEMQLSWCQSNATHSFSTSFSSWELNFTRYLYWLFWLCQTTHGLNILHIMNPVQ